MSLLNKKTRRSRRVACAYTAHANAAGRSGPNGPGPRFDADPHAGRSSNGPGPRSTPTPTPTPTAERQKHGLQRPRHPARQIIRPARRGPRRCFRPRHKIRRRQPPQPRHEIQPCLDGGQRPQIGQYRRLGRRPGRLGEEHFALDAMKDDLINEGPNLAGLIRIRPRTSPSHTDTPQVVPVPAPVP